MKWLIVLRYASNVLRYPLLRQGVVGCIGQFETAQLIFVGPLGVLIIVTRSYIVNHRFQIKRVIFRVRASL